MILPTTWWILSLLWALMAVSETNIVKGSKNGWTVDLLKGDGFDGCCQCKD